MNVDVDLPELRVEGTAAGEATGLYTDIALTNVFASSVQLLNSERAAIWQRYNAMLIASSIFVAAGRASSPPWAPVAMPLVGLVLCFAWYQLTIRRGWQVFESFRRVVRRYDWPTAAQEMNPLAFADEIRKSGDSIKRWAAAVIGLFALVYIAFLVEAVRNLVV